MVPKRHLLSAVLVTKLLGHLGEFMFEHGVYASLCGRAALKQWSKSTWGFSRSLRCLD
jgi:hypothetical protein